MSCPKVAVIILNYNRALDTLECLESVNKIDYPSYEILLVDNGSTEDCINHIKAAFPSVLIIENKKNLGFAEGNNRGIIEAKRRGADYFFLLNNDAIVDPQILQTFIQTAEKYPSAGVFGAKIYFYEQPLSIWYAGGGVDRKELHCFHVGRGESDLEKKRSQIKPTEYACGCALFVKKEAIEKAGLLFAPFFLIWEEIDWCFRMRQAGFECLFVPQAKVWHKISSSFEGGNQGPVWQYYYSRNRLLFLSRHFSLKEKLRYYCTQFPRECLHLIHTIYFKKSSHSVKQQYRAAVRGILHYFLNI